MDKIEVADKLPPLSRMFTGTTGKVFMLLSLMYFISYIDRSNLGIAVPLIMTEFHLTNTQMGYALAAFGWCYAAFQIVGGLAGDKFGGRYALAGLGIIWAIGTLMCGFAGGLGTLIAARVIVGLGEAGTLPNGARVISAWVPFKRRGFAQGFTHSASRLAAAITPLIMAWLISLYGWRGGFIALGGVSLLWTIAWFAYFRDDPKEKSGITQEEIDDLPAYSPYGKQVGKVPWGPLVKRTMPVTLVFFCHAYTLWLFLSWLPTFIGKTYHQDLAHTSFYTFAIFAAGVVGNTYGGLLTDLIYQRTGSLVAARRNAVVMGFGIAAVSISFVLIAPTVMLATLALAIAFFFMESTEGAIWSVPIDIAPKYAGSAAGIMCTASGVAAIISPIVFGKIVDVTGSYRIPFRGSIGLLLFGVVMAFFMRPDKQVVDGYGNVAGSAAMETVVLD